MIEIFLEIIAIILFFVGTIFGVALGKQNKKEVVEENKPGIDEPIIIESPVEDEIIEEPVIPPDKINEDGSEPKEEEPEIKPIEIEYTEFLCNEYFSTLMITRIKYPREVPKDTSFRIEYDFWSPYPDWVDVCGYLECRDVDGKCTIFKAPIRDKWFGKLSHAPKYLPYSYSGTRKFTCKTGIPKDSVWSIKFAKWDGKHYTVEDCVDLNIVVVS